MSTLMLLDLGEFFFLKQQGALRSPKCPKKLLAMFATD